MNTRQHTLCFKTEEEARQAEKSLLETTLIVTEVRVGRLIVSFQTETPLGPFTRSAVVDPMPKVVTAYWNCSPGTWQKPAVLRRATAGQILLVSTTLIAISVLQVSFNASLLDIPLGLIGVGIIAYYSLDILRIFRPDSLLQMLQKR